MDFMESPGPLGVSTAKGGSEMKKPIAPVVIAAAVALTTAFGQIDLRAQVPSPQPLEKHPGPIPDEDAGMPAQFVPVLGAPVTTNQLELKTEVDSTMTRMDSLMKQSLSLSQSFSSLAALHKGVDKSEILVMARVCDALGSMAAELKTTLVQYKHMVDDESSTESSTMRSEVGGLRVAMQAIAGEVNDAIRTLRRLEAQLGQG
jgi:hypothetical protein